MSDPANTDLFGTIHQLVLERALGQITAERFDELDRLLGASAEARHLYVQYIQETVGLQLMLGRDGHLPIPQVSAGDSTWLSLSPARTGRGGKGRAAMWAAVALVAGLSTAAIVLVGMVLHGAFATAMVRTWRGPRQAAATLPPAIFSSRNLALRLRILPARRIAVGVEMAARWKLARGSSPDARSCWSRAWRRSHFAAARRAFCRVQPNCRWGSEKSVFLTNGRFTATVESASARGFEVFAPGMRYTDLGTEFGVSVAQDGVQEMHVFRGKVTADEIRESEGEGDFDGAKGPEHTMSNRDSSGPLPQSPKSSSRHVTLTANQAIRIAAPGKPFERIAADEARFVRAMPALEPFPLFSTGVGLDRGGADSHWEIVSFNPDASFKPRAAVVADPEPDYCADARDKAQWVSLSKALPDLPGGCRMTFRTKFDLTGFDATTARIEGYCATDDWPVELRLNGHVSVPLPPEKRTLKLPVVPLEIEKGFVAGENVLEIVVENAVVPKMPLNHMALFVHWKGTARKAAKKD